MVMTIDAKGRVTIPKRWRTEDLMALLRGAD
jgi:bifunctional DNA-binding transcriptional regulator/antitoxin component of YhaV-PrlF toxin-antitoxin module